MKLHAVLAATIIGLPLSVAGAFAHSGAEMPQPFMQRHAIMGSLAAHLKSTKSAIANKDMQAAERQAEAIYWLAKILPDSFPKGSGPEMGKTRAAPKIWEDWAGFVAASDLLAGTASTLKSPAAAGDAANTETAFTALVRNGCGGCHKTYRAPK